MRSRPVARLAAIAAVSVGFCVHSSSAQDAPTPSAQSEPPEILEIRDGSNALTARAPQGGVIRLVGRGFHTCPKALARCAHPGLEVLVAQLPALVVMCEADELLLIVPARAKAERAARIEVRLPHGVATAVIEIVDASHWRGPQRGPEPGPRDPALPLQSFRLSRFARVNTEAGATLEVEGVAERVLDGMSVQVRLGVNGDAFPDGTRHVRVEGQRFRTTFGPFGKPLLCGNYSVDALFRLGQQSKRLRRAFAKTLTPQELEVYGRIQRRAFLQVGTGPGGALELSDLERQRELLKRHYTAACERWLDVLERVQRTVRAVGRVQFETGRFDQRGYLEFVQGVLEELNALHAEHARFNDRFASPIDAESDQIARRILSVVWSKFREWSRELYRLAQVNAPAALDAFDALDAPPNTSRKAFDAAIARLRRLHSIGSP